jgi:GT2 family glycosyltransferase/lipopolysaccharide/colanic/teichoic acid biosynthesis glycosyltransferase
VASRKRQNRPRVSVIIVNYNVRDFLHHAIVSLTKALKGISSEILVVDNASDDGSVAMIKKVFPRVRLFASPVNLGFAKANNLALRQARGEFLLMINPDTLVQEDTISSMIAFFEEHPDVGLAGCKILNPDGTFQLPCRRSFPTPWVAFTKMTGLSKLLPSTRLFGRYNLTYLSPDETYEIDAVSGSFMMLRKSVYNEVGGLDEDFFMYGEDLDWCYRIQRTGWRIYYVHSTQIIHYKGESTRRSDIDEIRTFYKAMHQFVRKHFERMGFFLLFLRLGITISSWVAMLRGFLRPFAVAVFDVFLINASLLVAEFLWKGVLFSYPAYAYPIVFIVPAFIVVTSLYAAGVYTDRKMSVSRTVIGVAVSYILIAAMVAFFKEYAFSRMVIVLSGMFSLVVLPGWRLVPRIFGNRSAGGRRFLLGRRTLVVGTDRSARELVRKLRARVGDGYQVLGFIDTTQRRVGEPIDGLPVVGSLENVGKVIHEKAVSDVIFSTEKLSYSDILSVIWRTRARMVSFHLVPNTLEVIIGKASVDSLDDVPLVQITYNIEKPWNRFVKRLVDLLTSGLLLISVYPFVYFLSAPGSRGRSCLVLELPSVLRGQKSLVGPQEAPAPRGMTTGFVDRPLQLGKTGLTGLVQLQSDRALSAEEVEQYHLYYARNQSFLLDLEILIKTAFRRRDPEAGQPGKEAAARRARPPASKGVKRSAGDPKEDQHG